MFKNYLIISLRTLFKNRVYAIINVLGLGTAIAICIVAWFNFKFDYFNSSSAKFILDVLILINNIHTDGLSMQIDWYYDENDEDIQEMGDELKEEVNIPFNIIMK